MNKNIVFSFIAFSILLSAFGQKNAVIDSLKNIVGTVEDDTNKVNSMNLLSSEYGKIRDHSMSMQYAESALELAEKLGFKKGVASSYNNIANIFESQDNYPEALKILFSLLETYEEIGDKRNIASTYNRIGRMYEYQSNYPKALEYQFASLKIKEEIGYKRGIASSYNNIGNVYQKQGKYAEALESFYTSLKIKEELEDKNGIAGAYNNLGNIYRLQDKLDEALENYLESLKIKKEIGRKGSVAGTSINIGNIYLDQNNYPKALEYFFASLEIFEEIGNKKYTAYCYNNIGTVYMAMGNSTEALKNLFAALKIKEEIGDKEGICNAFINIGDTYRKERNYQEARKYYNDGLALSKRIGSRDHIKKYYNSMSILDSADGNFVQALEHYKMYTLYKDSLLNEESNNQMALLKIQYESNKKDQEIDILNKDKALHEEQLEKQKLLRNGMIAGIFLIILVGLLLFRSLRLRKKLEKQQALVEERHRISADLHDDVGSGLSKITLLSELLKTQAKTPENRKEAEKISKTAQEISSTISEIIWALNSNNDFIENMVAYIRRYAAEYFEKSPVKLKIVTEGEILPTPINGENRRNIFYTVKEALNNILKHAQATEAELKFVLVNDKLEIIISDNGKGIPDENLNQFGNGINNMRARMNSINGDFKIESHPGTTINLKLAV